MSIIEKSYRNEVLDKYFQKKHVILLLISERKKFGKLTTVLDIEHEYNITRHYAWNLVEMLINDELVGKGPKVKKNGNEYCTYIPTKKANDELGIVSKSIDLSVGENLSEKNEEVD